MREILFRGKRKLGNEWIEGSLHTEKFADDEEYLCCEINQCDVYPETVGQYTDLTDKNGKRIFEGDIVKGDREYFTYTHPYGRVVYDGGQFLIAFDDALEDIECLGAWANAVEVIGNIHDNPELFKGE